MSRPAFVVVGAGTAGCVVAGRLAHAGLAVALVEAGAAALGEPSAPFPAIAASPARTWDGPVIAWGTGGPPRRYVRGRGVGGTALVNGMVVSMGEPDDYDRWAALHGCRGWAWADVAPWFERVRVPQQTAAAGEWGPLARRAVEQGWARPVPLARDAAGRRVTTASYLAGTDVEVMTGAVVEGLQLHGRRAIGVRLAGGRVIESGRGVVVCAGTFATPGILAGSGLDDEQLGTGLHDHPSFTVPVTGAGEPGEGQLAVCAAGRWQGDRSVEVLPVDMPSGAVVMVSLLRAISRGTVESPGLLSDDRDVARLGAAVTGVGDLLRSSGLVVDVATDELDRARLVAGLGGYHHAASTCRMGDGGPLDERLAVRGCEGLWVCDASAIPELPQAGPHLVVAMMAERLAGWLTDD